MPEPTNYSKDAEDDARDTVENFMDEIVEKLVDEGEASDDLHNDYSGGDSYHHETHIDRSYSLLEAAQLLDELSNHEETDSGLWEGQEPRQAVETQAAFTYGNAVMSEWNDFIEKINDEVPQVLDDMRAERDSKVEELKERLGEMPEDDPERESLKKRIEELEDDDVFGEKLKKAARRAAESAVGLRRKPQGKGPLEWMPD
jgi:hypothetical protein